MEPFATVEDVQRRLDWTLDAAERTMAATALDDTSEMARGIGREWAIPESAPRLVRSIVLRSVIRYMKNPNGYTQSRAGDETVTWTDLGADAGAPYFTDDETRLIEKLAGTGSRISSAPVSAWGPMRKVDCLDGMVPVAGGGDLFPMYSGDGPW